jgi:hypothetical protein
MSEANLMDDIALRSLHTAPAEVAQTAPSLEPALQRVVERVRLRAQRRIAWLHQLWAEEVATSTGTNAVNPQTVTPAEVAAILADRDNPAAETVWIENEPTLKPLNSVLAQLEAAIETDNLSRLALLREIFGLSAREGDVFQLCLALALDPALERVYAYLQDRSSRNYATEELAARLFNHGCAITWKAESPLRYWDLVSEREVSPTEPHQLVCDRQVRDWLLDINELNEALVGVAQLWTPLAPLEGWPVDDLADSIARRLEERENCRVFLFGPPGSGRRTLAACISERLGLPVLVVNADTVDEADWRVFFQKAQRQAFLDRCALAWCGDAILHRPWPHITPHFPLQFVICEAGQPRQRLAGVVEFSYEMPSLSQSARRKLWQNYLPTVLTWEEKEFDSLVNLRQANPGEIAAVSLQSPASLSQASAILSAIQRSELGRLAQRLEIPFTWKDLVINDDLRRALEDLVYEAQVRASFWEREAARRLFPQGRGLVGLFTGSPGTGKTMAAQVIAASLGLELFRIDLSAVVSKYVGETSQNMERVLSRAASLDIILLFDEADALFGKRTEIKDAHDRFANTDTNYLLQAIESYPGIALLATNKKGNLDPAFIRRIRYVLDFPRPDAAQRLRIWRQIIGELAGEEALRALDTRLDALAQTVDATGAQIKFAVLAAIFSAQREGQPLTMTYLLHGLERELVKDGSALSSRERERLLG